MALSLEWTEALPDPLSKTLCRSEFKTNHQRQASSSTYRTYAVIHPYPVVEFFVGQLQFLWTG